MQLTSGALCRIALEQWVLLSVWKRCGVAVMSSTSARGSQEDGRVQIMLEPRLKADWDFPGTRAQETDPRQRKGV